MCSSSPSSGGGQDNNPNRSSSSRMRGLSPGAAQAAVGAGGSRLAGRTDITVDQLGDLNRRRTEGQLGEAAKYSGVAGVLNAIGKMAANRMMNNLMRGDAAVVDKSGRITGTRNSRGQLTGRDTSRVTGNYGDDNNEPNSRATFVQQKPKPQPAAPDDRVFGDQLASAGYNPLLINKSGQGTDRENLRIKKTKGTSKQSKGVGLNVVKV